MTRRDTGHGGRSPLDRPLWWLRLPPPMAIWADANGIETLGELASVSPATLRDEKDLGQESVAETRAVIERALGRSWESFAAVAATIARSETARAPTVKREVGVASTKSATSSAPSAKREKVRVTSAEGETDDPPSAKRKKVATSAKSKTAGAPSAKRKTVRATSATSKAGAARSSKPYSARQSKRDSNSRRALARSSSESTLSKRTLPLLSQSPPEPMPPPELPPVALPPPPLPCSSWKSRRRDADGRVSRAREEFVGCDFCMHCARPIESSRSRPALLHGWAMHAGGGALGMLCVATDGEGGTHVPVVEFDLERGDFKFRFCDTTCLRALLNARIDELEKAGDGGEN